MIRKAVAASIPRIQEMIREEIARQVTIFVGYPNMSLDVLGDVKIPVKGEVDMPGIRVPNGHVLYTHDKKSTRRSAEEWFKFAEAVERPLRDACERFGVRKIGFMRSSDQVSTLLSTIAFTAANGAVSALTLRGIEKSAREALAVLHGERG